MSAWQRAAFVVARERALGAHALPAALALVMERATATMSERLVSDLTAWRTLALQDAFAKDPATAFVSVLHAFVLSCFFGYSSEGCVQVRVNPVSFSNEPPGLRDSAPGQAIAERREEWRTRMPKSDKDIWDWVLALGSDDQWALFAHCVSVGVNAQREAVKYDNGRISPHGVERRVAHSHVIARAVGLDVIAAGWKAKADAYLAAVPKPRILADVTEARGENFAQMIDHLKKADMAREAERLLEDTDWLPEPLRTPELEPVASRASTEPGSTRRPKTRHRLPIRAAQWATFSEMASASELRGPSWQRVKGSRRCSRSARSCRPCP